MIGRPPQAWDIGAGELRRDCQAPADALLLWLAHQATRRSEAETEGHIGKKGKPLLQGFTGT